MNILTNNFGQFRVRNCKFWSKNGQFGLETVNFESKVMDFHSKLFFESKIGVLAQKMDNFDMKLANFCQN